MQLKSDLYNLVKRYQKQRLLLRMGRAPFLPFFRCCVSFLPLRKKLSKMSRYLFCFLCFFYYRRIDSLNVLSIYKTSLLNITMFRLFVNISRFYDVYFEFDSISMQINIIRRYFYRVIMIYWNNNALRTEIDCNLYLMRYDLRPF